MKPPWLLQIDFSNNPSGLTVRDFALVITNGQDHHAVSIEMLNLMDSMKMRKLLIHQGKCHVHQMKTWVWIRMSLVRDQSGEPRYP